jgi:hypothetical protein
MTKEEIEKKIKAIKVLHDRAKAEYEDYREKHDGEWMSGSMYGFEAMSAYKRVLAILNAPETDIETLRDISDFELFTRERLEDNDKKKDKIP